MLPKKHRLPAYLIPEVLKKGDCLQSLDFNVFVLPNTEKIIRLAIIVPLRTSKSAVKRNRIKRLFKETIKANLNKMKEGGDLIFLIKNKVLGKSFWEIKKATETFLIKEKIINNNEKNSS